MRKILICFILIATAPAAWAVDVATVVRQCNSPVYDQKLMRACGMLATQLQLDPINRAIAYDLRARAYLALGQFDYAILDATQALALLEKPSDPSIKATDQFKVRTHAYAIRSASLAKSGQSDKAIADRAIVLAQLSEMVERYSSAEGYSEMAFAKHVLGEDAEALEAAEKALVWNPTDPEALSTRAEIHEALGHKDAAIEDYRASLRYTVPDNSNASYKLILAAQTGLARMSAKP
jgi:tetratricopeptide (TPR) repeat protein